LRRALATGCTLAGRFDMLIGICPPMVSDNPCDAILYGTLTMSIFASSFRNSIDSCGDTPGRPDEYDSLPGLARA
jgi:hypothetical protein